MGNPVTKSRAPTLNQALAKLAQIKNYLNSLFVAREQQINAVLCNVISLENAILLGPPGTVKTSIIKTTAQLFNMRFYKHLMTPFDEKIELIGYLDVKEFLENKKIQYIYTDLVSSHIVYFDEIFKSSSSVRNMLLEILEERTVDNKPTKILAVFSSSNEISTDAEDSALYDRFTIRDFHDYIDETYLGALLEKALELDIRELEKRINYNFEAKNASVPQLTIEDLKVLVQEVIKRSRAILKKQEYIDKIKEFIIKAKEKGIILSDRRKHKILKVASAYSIVLGKKETTLDDIGHAIIWITPFDAEDIPKIQELIDEIGFSEYAEEMEIINTIKTEANNLLQQLVNANDMPAGQFKVLLKQITAFSKNAMQQLSSIKQEELKKQVDDAKALIVKLLNEVKSIIDGKE